MKVKLWVITALGYALIIGLTAWMVMNVFVQEIKPGVRQAIEDTLVDSAYLLAELVAEDVATAVSHPSNPQTIPANPDPDNTSTPSEGSAPQLAHPLNDTLRRYRMRSVAADIWNISKQTLDYRIYITDAQGKVIASTEEAIIGQDYSQWRDVYLTLRHQYGARTTRDVADDDTSSTMYVAAPIVFDDQLVGVLTVAKPSKTVQPFIDRTHLRLQYQGLFLILITLVIATLFTWHLTRSIGRLRQFAIKVSQGQKSPPPQSSAHELSELADALLAMKAQLEGKHYVEHYVHTLSHELKSPIAAIRGAAELLTEHDMPAANQQRFVRNILEQSQRMHQITDHMLRLARVEHQHQLETSERIDWYQLTCQTINSMKPSLDQRKVAVQPPTRPVFIQGDPFLIQQAIVNLVENALDFSAVDTTVQLCFEWDHEEGKEGKTKLDRKKDIHLQESSSLGELTTAQPTCTLWVLDQGCGIPPYALDQVFDRFFSLARPAQHPLDGANAANPAATHPRAGRKSTGLGLPFVREVAQLHGGYVHLHNRSTGGVQAGLTLPASA